ncbi:histidine--tRNA ligase, chloroplastic/mitochondrial-like [Carex rostrata]
MASYRITQPGCHCYTGIPCQVLQAVLQMYAIPENLFTQVCVIVDKLGKITREEMEEELVSLGVSIKAVNGIIKVLSLKSLSKLEEVLGSEGEAVSELKKLFSLAESYGYADRICFHASVVRGLAYYTGLVFEFEEMCFYDLRTWTREKMS